MIIAIAFGAVISVTPPASIQPSIFTLIGIPLKLAVITAANIDCPPG